MRRTRNSVIDARGVEAAGCFRSRDVRNSTSGSGPASGLVLQDTFVDRPKLLDAEIGIRDAVATMGTCGRRQRQDRATHHGIGNTSPFDVRSVCGRKQAAIERGDVQVACTATVVCES